MTSSTLKRTVIAAAMAAALTGAYSVGSERALWPAQAAGLPAKIVGTIGEKQTPEITVTYE